MRILLTALLALAVTPPTAPVAVAPDLMATTASQGPTPFSLKFDSLPSAQGWTYFQSDGIPETRVFSVTGTSLIQDSIGIGEHNPNYAMFGVVDGTKPFVLTVRARILAYEGAAPFGFFFDVRTASPNQEYAIGFTPSRLQDPLGNGVAVDTTVFHTYVLRATPGGPYTLDMDGHFAFSGPFSATGGALNAVQVGDNAGMGPTNARAEVTKLEFSQNHEYVALGDSYSSGEGDLSSSFFPGTDGPTNFCHRSMNAYPQLLGRTYNFTPKFYACSGAKTANITGQFMFNEPPQITRPGVDTTASLVTMTIGGNNAGFSDLLKSCIAQKLNADFNNSSTIRPVALWLGLGLDPSCANSQSFIAAANTQIDNVVGPAKDTYQALLSKTSPTDTSIVVAGYPHLFPDSDSEQRCPALAFILTPQDEQYFDLAGDRLDENLKNAAGQAGVNFVDVRPAFRGHAVCGNAGSWINGLSVASGSGQPCTMVRGLCIWPAAPIAGSFHPNATGQSGYASAIRAYIDAATNRTPEGFPLNPNQPPDPPATAAVPSVAVGALDVLPVTQGTADCEGSYQAGQTLTVAGDGFAPGATVSFYVTSPGLGLTGEQQVGTATADPNGKVSATIRVPLAATGFTPSGASAGLVFADAIGLGAGGTHVDDVASAGLVPHTSSCGTVEPYPFTGFFPPIDNPPAINSENAGRTIPMRFTLAGSGAVLSQVLAAGYPQSAPVSCTSPEQLTSGDPTIATSSGDSSSSDDYNYLWKTDRSWTGCRELIVKLVDGTYHRAVVDFQ